MRRTAIERARGIEPLYRGWKPRALPLSYARVARQRSEGPDDRWHHLQRAPRRLADRRRSRHRHPAPRRRLRADTAAMAIIATEAVRLRARRRAPARRIRDARAHDRSALPALGTPVPERRDCGVGIRTNGCRALPRAGAETRAVHPRPGGDASARRPSGLAPHVL